jgi:hypothetical protein
MVDENHFRFDRKTFFNFWKTIYGFKNCKSFSEIKLSILVRTFDIRLLETGNGRLSNPDGTGIRQHPATRILPVPESGRICMDPATDHAGSDRDSKESGNGDRTLPDSDDSCIFSFCNFFVRTKRRKIFSKKYFFLKIISSKIFYDGNYFTLKQTEHQSGDTINYQ